METIDIQEAKKEQIKKEKLDFLQSIIVASARYERLLANKDFQDVLSDLQNVVKVHEEEIAGYLKAYSFTTSFFKKMRLAEVLGQHQMRKTQIEEAISYPNVIVEKARQAREELSTLKAQEKEITHV